MVIKYIQSENKNSSFHIAQKDNANNETTKQVSNNKSHNSDKRDKTYTIYAGSINSNQDTITMKKLLSQKKAMKAIIDQFSKEKEIDNGIQVRREHQKVLATDAEIAMNAIRDIKNGRQNLEEAYSVTEDSEDQKELKLLEKSMFGNEELTEEEMKLLEDMGPLSEYQKEALRFDAMEQIWNQRIKEAQNGITNENRTIITINLARLKTHPMLDAQKEAAKIIEEANKEVIGIIIEETKEKIDEKQKEIIENAEKQKDATKNKENIPMNNLMENVVEQEQLLRDLMSIANKHIVIEEDIKGIVVDEQM